MASDWVASTYSIFPKHSILQRTPFFSILQVLNFSKPYARVTQSGFLSCKSYEKYPIGIFSFRCTILRLYHFLQMKINFLLLKINFLLLKINFLLLKFNFLLLKINFLLLKFNFLLATENQVPLAENQFPPNENQFPLTEIILKFISMSINFQFNVIIDVFLCLKWTQ